MLCSFGYHVAMCCDMLGVVGSSLKMVKFGPTRPNTSQHGGQTHATCCAKQCCDMLHWHIVWPGLKKFQLLRQSFCHLSVMPPTYLEKKLPQTTRCSGATWVPEILSAHAPERFGYGKPRTKSLWYPGHSVWWYIRKYLKTWKDCYHFSLGFSFNKSLSFVAYII